MQISRLLVRNEREYASVIENSNATNCFSSVYTIWQRKNNVPDSLFLETDYSSRDVADEKHEVIMTYFRTRGYHVRVNFSGRRSYHYYLDFLPTKMVNFGDRVRNWVKEIPGDFDKSVVGDLSQMARIPGTIHGSTGLFCVPINSVANSVFCTNLSQVRIPEIIPNHGLVKELSHIKVPKMKAVTKIRADLLGTSDTKVIPPCILSSMNYAKNTGLCPHFMRLHLAAYLLKTTGLKTTFNFFKDTMKDVIPHFTQYQLNYMIKRNWFCFKCDRAKGLGICPLSMDKVCYFYPSINWHL